MSATILDGPRAGSVPRARLRDDEPTAWPVVVLTVVVMLPILVAGLRAATGDWVAIGDDANMLIRSRDVLTGHHPLLGTWSSASVGIGEDVNHPGPLLFDLLALPAKLAGSGGMAMGVALLNAACVAAIAVFARRAGGTRAAVCALAGAGALAWTMGSALLHDPWNPHVVLFPFLLVLVLVWSMLRGDDRALPVAAGVASLVVQTHVSFAPVVGVLCALGFARLVLLRRREVLGAAIVALVVLLACWAQPIADQIGGEGNLASLAGGVGGAGESVGGARGREIVADVVAIPPWWARPSFEDAMRFPPGQPRFVDGEPNVDGLPSSSTASIALAGLAVVLVGAALVARRRRDGVALAILGVCSTAIVVSLVVVITQPVGAAGLSAHQQRYLWPISIVTMIAVLMTVLPARWVVAVASVGAVVASVLALPAHRVDAGPTADSDVMPAVRELAVQLERADLDDEVLVDTATRFADPWTSALMAILQDDGIDFRVTDSGWIRQLGNARADEGDAKQRIFLREGSAATEVPDGARRVAFVPGLDDDERRELGRLERSLRDVEIVLDDDGEAALAVGGLPEFESGPPSASVLLESGALASLLEIGLLEVPADRAEDLGRYETLRRRWDRQTIAVFVDPTPYDD